MSTRLLAFSGSLRAESFNTRLAFLAADLAESKGAVVTRLKLQDLNLPMFDEDSEAASGLPAGAKELKDLMRAHDGFLIATPEYNGFMSGALKNAIDWATRPEEGHPPLDCFRGKVAGIMAASPGGLGGIRGLPMLRLLSNIGMQRRWEPILPPKCGLGLFKRVRKPKQRHLNNKSEKFLTWQKRYKNLPFFL